ncbi:MAG: NAD(P)/FAD-dependent oxidoreductase [Thermoplasmata archaeon]|nr:NAD(P)/FAD-dependent oxidoreductase [Candidatus Thermoplasmatota archaeon]MCK4949292.1 NAD(P)/FAD-dependent oxidoreductase [Thermoplasmata archaeon]
MKNVVVLGGGVGGSVVANHLAKKAKRGDCKITVVDEDGKHVYQPGFLYVTLGKQNPAKLVRDERTLLKRSVDLVTSRAERIDPGERTVHLAGGKKLDYDYLVIATGSTLHPEQVPGFEGAHHFYSLEGSIDLRNALMKFNGGDVVIAVGGVPYKCPPAPAESACLLDYYFTKRRMREKVNLKFLSPLGRVFPLESLDPLVTEVFKQKNVEATIFFNIESIDPKSKKVESLEGETVNYDLLIAIPPHSGADVVIDSGLGDRGGWIPTDRHSLLAKGHGDIYAVGDATDIPISKAGATAHYEGLVVGDNIAARLNGQSPPDNYDGKVTCFCDAGFHRGIMMTFDYENPPVPPPLNRRHYLGKMMINRLYWMLIPKARV